MAPPYVFIPEAHRLVLTARQVSEGDTTSMDNIELLSDSAVVSDTSSRSLVGRDPDGIVSGTPAGSQNIQGTRNSTSAQEYGVSIAQVVSDALQAERNVFLGRGYLVIIPKENAPDLSSLLQKGQRWRDRSEEDYLKDLLRPEAYEDIQHPKSLTRDRKARVRK